MKKKSEQSFSTTDLGCAAALLCAGFKIKSTGGNNPRKTVFTFEPDKNILEESANYWNNNLTVDAQTFFGTFHALKNRVYSHDVGEEDFDL
ncbi:MAG: hypothetical protein KGJ58_04530 [Patescibacteria group bacterium]|nr:hypothetical protein [Patescibacteria group bacterium]